MEDDILDSLEELGYSGSLLEKDTLQKSADDGPKSVEYTKLVEWLSQELKVLCKLEDHINAITSPDDSSSFLLEVSSFLKELNCPYKSLTEGAVTQRLINKQSRLQLLDFLCTELQAARMIAQNKPELTPKGMQVEVQESSTAADLKNILVTLGFPKPPSNITPGQLFSKVETKIKDLLSKLPSKSISKPLFVGVLSDKQWHILEGIQDELKKEYFIRREMLIKRLDVTIQSFKWSSRAKNKDNEITTAYFPIRKPLALQPDISLADLLAAREEIAVMEKTSGASVRLRTKSAVNKVLMGRVPDRGGRPSEQQAPPPEMPSWQKRSDGPSHGGGNRGNSRGGSSGGGGDRGGRVQGSWSGGGGNQQNANWNQGGKGGNWGGQQGGNRGGQQTSGREAYQSGGGFQGGEREGYQNDGGRGGYYQDNDYRGGSGGRGGGRGRGGRGGGRQNNRGGGNPPPLYVDLNAAAYYQNQGPQYYANVDYTYTGYGYDGSR